MMTINNQIFSDYFTGHLNQTVEAPRAHICGCRHPHSRRRPPSRSGSRFFGCLNLEHVVFFGKTLGAVFSCPSCFFWGDTHVGSVDPGENVRMWADYVDWKSHPFQQGKSLLKNANPTNNTISFASSNYGACFGWNFHLIESMRIYWVTLKP